MKNLGTKLSNLAIALLFIVGLAILFYPTFSDAYNRYQFTKVVISYKEEIRGYEADEAEVIMHQARAYNEQLHRGLVASETYTPIEYNPTLNLYNGMMGYIEISKINVSLPIYHGTSDEVLQKGVGHLDWTSLPTGEEGNHVVLTGHTGLPSAKLFTDVDKLEIGDSFAVRVLNEDYYYKISEIIVVEPHEVDSLVPIRGRELVTLVTCTPYGINSHRLLVTGERYYPTAAEIPALLMEDEESNLAFYLGIGVLGLAFVVGLVLLFLKFRKKKEKNPDAVNPVLPDFLAEDIPDFEVPLVETKPVETVRKRERHSSTLSEERVRQRAEEVAEQSENLKKVSEKRTEEVLNQVSEQEIESQSVVLSSEEQRAVEREKRREERARRRAEEQSSQENVERPERGTRERSGERVERTTRERSGERVERTTRERSGERVERTTRERSGERVERTTRERSGERVERTTGERSGERVERTNRERSGDRVERGNRERSGERVERANRERSGERAERTNRERSGERAERGNRERSGDRVERATREQSGERAERTNRERSEERVGSTPEEREQRRRERELRRKERENRNST